MWPNFFRSLAAVIIGNAIYFGIMRYLPKFARHDSFRIDFGLIIDFWICLVIWGILAWIARYRLKRQS
jgi:hypothetical protein